MFILSLVVETDRQSVSRDYDSLGFRRNHCEGSDIRVATTITSAIKVPTQLTHQILEGMDRNKMDRTHSTSCMGVPNTKKSLVYNNRRRRRTNEKVRTFTTYSSRKEKDLT
jgi:hypothetical protein